MRNWFSRLNADEVHSQLANEVLSFKTNIEETEKLLKSREEIRVRIFKLFGEKYVCQEDFSDTSLLYSAARKLGEFLLREMPK